MQEQTMTLEEKEFRLFQAIRKIQAEPEEKEILIERLIQQIESVVNSEPLPVIFTEQFQEAENLYKEHPEMIVADKNPSAEWGEDFLNSQMSSNAYKEWLQAENDIYDDLFKDEVT